MCITESKEEKGAPGHSLTPRVLHLRPLAIVNDWFLPLAESEESMSIQPEASRITVDEFTEATFKAVLRAMEARKPFDREQGIFPGPILYGIIWWPEGGPFGPGTVLASPGQPGREG